MYVCMYVYYVRTYVCIYVYYVRKYVCNYVYVQYVCMFICVYLYRYRLKHPDVFDLIQRHNLWHALLNNLMNLLELDVEVCAYNNFKYHVWMKYISTTGVHTLVNDVYKCPLCVYRKL